ncbi:MAG: benzoate-CoA ligase family protein [Gammaproteobacteria bacterium]
MPELSRVDPSQAPPRLHIPKNYNAAHDLIQRNLQIGIADKIAYVDDESSLTFGELDRRSSAFAHTLGVLGIERGQRILMCMQDTIDFPVVFLGSIKAGIVPVPVNTLLTQSDYAYMLKDCRAPLVVVSASLMPMIDPLRATLPDLRRILIAGGDIGHDESLTRHVDRADAGYQVADTVSDEPCFWLYSSGSTGAPKGTVHVHSSLIYTAELYGRPILGINQDDVCFSAAKLFFAYGLGNSLTFPLAVGASTILMAERPTPAAVFARLAKHQPTIFSGVPTLYAGMLASPDLPQVQTGRLRRCVSAGEPLPEDIGRRWQRRFGVDILDGIGSTEMLHIFISNRPGEVQYGTTGRPVPGYAVRLVDDLGNPVARGEQGELQVAGHSSAVGYWNNPERTRSTFVGPWTRTGDKYVERDDGCLVYAGRTDDMLKVSGIYVSPSEVESALISHEAVLEAAVVGREDQDGLVKPIAYIVVKSSVNADEALSTELKLHVKTRLAPYKYPRWIEFRNELPKTATGKIQRFKLRERAPASLHRGNDTVQRLTIDGHSLEYRYIAAASTTAPTLVFLHEGLGSISLWRDFPDRLAAACACNALVYSRHGNGFSDTLAEARRPDYMHREGIQVLPEILDRLAIRRPILFGHSDGASIAIIHEGLGPRTAAGIILCAPHIFVEEVTLRSIQAAKLAYESTDLRSRLARHHADVDKTFHGWNDIWLHEDFRNWSIEGSLINVRCPILAIQGADDEYGTYEQVDRIAVRTTNVDICKLDDCRHSPHRDQPTAVIEATVKFIQQLGRNPAT